MNNVLKKKIKLKKYPFLKMKFTLNILIVIKSSLNPIKNKMINTTQLILLVLIIL